MPVGIGDIVCPARKHAGENAIEQTTGGDGPIIQGEEYTAPLYEPGSSRTIYKRGDEYTAPLYSSGSSETVTVQGSAVSQTLYYKSSSGNYIAFGETLYRAGSRRTFNKRGSLIDTALFYDGGSETIREQGNLLSIAVHRSGTKRANLKLATFDATTAVLAYAK